MWKLLQQRLICQSARHSLANEAYRDQLLNTIACGDLAFSARSVQRLLVGDYDKVRIADTIAQLTREKREKQVQGTVQYRAVFWQNHPKRSLEVDFSIRTRHLVYKDGHVWLDKVLLPQLSTLYSSEDPCNAAAFRNWHVFIRSPETMLLVLFSKPDICIALATTAEEVLVLQDLLGPQENAAYYSGLKFRIACSEQTRSVSGRGLSQLRGARSAVSALSALLLPQVLTLITGGNKPWDQPPCLTTAGFLHM